MREKTRQKVRHMFSIREVYSNGRYAFVILWPYWKFPLEIWDHEPYVYFSYQRALKARRELWKFHGL